jgi:hypothetical protein
MPIRVLGMVASICTLALISCGGGSSGNGSGPAPVIPQPADFQLQLVPDINAQIEGVPQFQTIAASPINGFSGTISLTLSGMPAGVTTSGSLSISLTGAIRATTLQLAASQSASPGSTVITVTGTSGTIVHTATFSLTVRQAAPFKLAVNSSSIALTPASTALLQLSLTSDPATSPQANLTVSGVPNTAQVNVDTLPGFITPAAPASLRVVATVLAQPLSVPLGITASDNANNTSFLSIPLTVTVPFASNTTPTRSTFFRTDRSPTGMVCDRVRKLLFVSVEVLNEVVVLSSVDGHQVASIPVGFPGAIDESADGSATYVASPLVGGVTTIDPDLLQVIRHSNVPQSVSGFGVPVTFFQEVALSNGKVLFYPTFDMIDVTKPPFYLWDPKTDTFTLFGLPNVSFSLGLLTRSADHSKVLGYGGVFPDGFLYDVATGTFLGPDAAITGFPAIRPDGSQLASLSNQGLTFYDSHLTPLASLPAISFQAIGGVPRLFYSLDGGHLYVVPDQNIGIGAANSVAVVIDTNTFALTGMVPSFFFGVTESFSGQWMTSFDMDETGMLFGAAFPGVGFLDMSSPTFLQEPLPGAFGVLPSLASLSSPTQAQLDGAGFAQAPALDVFIGPPPASPQSLKATNISVQSANFVNLAVPAGTTAGPANVTLTRSDGFFEVRPDAVTFGPTILRIDADGGSPAGGDPITIVGYGLSAANTQVSIGGKPATNSQQTVPISIGDPFPTERIKLVTPAGVAGMADVTVSTISGSSTVAGGFQYLNSVQVNPIVGALDAIVYDKLRKRVYASNEDHNRVEIFDLGTNTFLASVAVGNGPTALALTPDSNNLAVVNSSDGSISLINLLTNQVAATYPVLTTLDRDPVGCGGVALNITPAGPHRALVDIDCSALLLTGVFHLINLDTGVIDCTGIAGCAANGTDIAFGNGLAALASTSDGSKIFLAASGGVGLLDLNANTLVSGPAGNLSDAAVSTDGTIFAGSFAVFNSVNLSGIMAIEPYADSGSQSFHNVFGEKLNPSGSLLFYPQDSGVDIFDTHTGRLVRHLVLPDPIPADTNGMALDETGTKMFLISQSGITIAQLFQAPLSLATVNPAAGPQGASVVLRGSGFQNGATVEFGSLQVSTVFVDSNTLQAIVPPLPPGPVRVLINNPDGHQYSLDAGYIVQ